MVDQASVQDLGDEIVSNSFYVVGFESMGIVQVFRLCQQAAFGVDSDNNNIWIVFFEFPCNTRTI